MQIIFAMLFVLSFQANAQNNAVRVHSVDELLLIGKKVTFLEDKTGVLSPLEITAPNIQHKFEAYNKDIFVRPATPSAFWFKFSASNLSAEDLWFEVGSTYAEYIDFYKTDSLGQLAEVGKQGTMRPDSLKYYQNMLFWFPLEQAGNSQTQVYYCRITSSLPFETPFYVGTLRALQKKMDTGNFLSAAFIGLMLIMFLYNLFLYISTKDHNYFWYLGYLLWMGVGMPYASNFPFIQHLEFGFIDKAWWHSYFIVWHAPAYFFIGMFCIYYLDLRTKSPLLFKLIVAELIIISFIFPVLALFGIKQVYFINIFQAFLLVFYISCLSIAYFRVLKGDKHARYYTLGWTFLILFVLVFFATVNGYFPYTTISRHSLYFAVALEVWMFSLALGDRINIIRKEKEATQKELFNLMETQNEVLQERVKERTEELHAVMEEIEEMNKILIVQNDKLEDTNKTKDKLFSVIGHDLVSPIASIQSLLDLSISGDINHSEFKEFAYRFKNKTKDVLFMLNNLLHWANSQKEGIITHATSVNLHKLLANKISLLTEKAEDKNIVITNSVSDSILLKFDENQLGIICLNLLSNALKYTPKSGSISVTSRFTENNMVEIAFTDTGAGMDDMQISKLFNSPTSTLGTNGEKGNGIGLSLCNDFVARNGGKIWAESKVAQGSMFYITAQLF